jgi:dTDP-4-amino-4,6-dideoxygalactose transaminase
MNINYGKHYIDNIDREEAIKVLKSGWLTQGPSVNKFELDLKKYFNSKYCVVVSNGTAALHLAIKVLNLKIGTKVLTTPITFISTASSIIMNQLIPEFADIDKNTFTLDPNYVEYKLKKDKKIKVIVGVDYAGHPCDWESLNFLKKKYNLILINDNCHAMGSNIKGNKGYAVKYADIVTHSFHPVKNFTTCEGGSILTNNKSFYESFLLLRSHGMIKSKKNLNKYGSWFYEVKEIGYNYRLTDLQSAIGSSQLKKLDKFVTKRRHIADFYNRIFCKYEFMDIPKTKKNIQHSFHLYPLLINFKSKKISKKFFFRKMKEKGINLQVHYIPLHFQPFLKNNFSHIKNTKYPVAENFYNQEVSLPIYFSLKYNELKYVAKNIVNFFK